MRFVPIRRAHLVGLILLVGGLCHLGWSQLAAAKAAKKATTEVNSNAAVDGGLPIPDASATSAQKGCVPAKENKLVTLDLKDEVPVDGLLKAVQTYYCKTVVYAIGGGSGGSGRGGGPPASLPKMYIQAPKSISVGALRSLVTAALTSVGLAIQERGRDVWVITEAARARDSAPVVAEVSQGGDKYVTKVFKVNYLTAQDVQSLAGSAGREGTGQDRSLIYVPSTKSLVAIDTATNVQRFAALLRQIDVAPKVCWLRSQQLPPAALADTLRTLLVGNASGSGSDDRSILSRRTSRFSRSSGGDGPALQVAADESSGLVFVLGGTRDVCARAVAVAKLAESNAAQPSVVTMEEYPLRFIGPEQAIALLKPLGVSAHLVETPQSEPVGTSGGLQGGSAGSSSPRRTSSRSRDDGDTPNDDKAGGSMFSQGLQVVGDASSNILQIFGNSIDRKRLKEYLRQIDFERPSAYVEATIVEITLSNDRNVGLSYHGALPFLGGNVMLGLQGSTLKSLNPLAAATLPGLIGGLMSNEKTTLGTTTATDGTTQTATVPQAGLVLQLFASATDINIRQTPGIYTKNGGGGVFEAGQEFGAPGAFSNPVAGSTGSLLPAVSVQRMTAGYKIDVRDVKINPQHGTADMHVYVNASDIVPGTERQTSKDTFYGGPSIAKRVLETDIRSFDGRPVVIGGIVIEKDSRTDAKIPILGDLPLLGTLFRQRSSTRSQSILLIVLTPHIFKTGAEHAKFTEQKLGSYRNLVVEKTQFPIPDIAKVDYSKGLTPSQALAWLIAEEERRRDALAPKPAAPVQHGTLP